MDKLLIWTPTYADKLRPETLASVGEQDFAGHVDWIISDDNPYPGASNKNVCHQYQIGREIALDGGYDAMLCVEHDMILPPGCVQTLWDTDAPVVYAIYMLRHNTNVVSLFRKEASIRAGIGMSLSLYPQELKVARQVGVVEVSGAGFGCTLMRREALQAVPMRMADRPPDLPFASDCVRRGILQMGRLDVACGHYDIKSDRILQPFEEHGGVIARVLALQTINVTIDGQTTAIKRDRYYSMPVSVARELERAGYVQITNDADEVDTEPEREVAVSVEAEAREKATTRKIRPKRRTRKPRRAKDKQDEK